MFRITSLLAALAFASTAVLAQAPGFGPDPQRMAAEITQYLGLDAARAQKVTDILGAAHQQAAALRSRLTFPTTEADRQAMHYAMFSLHEQTREQIAAVLTADEMAKLEEHVMVLRRKHAPAAS